MSDATTSPFVPNHPEDVIKEILACGSEAEVVGFFRSMEHGLQQACVALGQLHNIEIQIKDWNVAKDQDGKSLKFVDGKCVMFPSYYLLKHLPN